MNQLREMCNVCVFVHLNVPHSLIFCIVFVLMFYCLAFFMFIFFGYLCVVYKI